MVSEQRVPIERLFSLGGRPAGSRSEIKIIDTTLRDAHQCLWATRMTTEHITSILESYQAAGFHQVDLMATIQFDVPVRYLKEDPWERVRRVCQSAPDLHFRSLIRSKNIAAFDFLADDIINKWVERLYDNGLDVIGSFDGLNDVDNIAGGLRMANEVGAYTFGALSFCESPLHTDEHYMDTARQLIDKANVDSIMIKDAGGLLTPDRIRTLVPALKSVIGDRPLELHSHCMTGLAPLVYLEAVELGCDQLHTSIAPLANGAAQPATQSIVRSLRELGYQISLDDARIERISQHFAEIAKRERKPVGWPLEYNARHYMHQLPGGMLSNYRAQLEAAGIIDKFEALLEEIGRVRSELAWPIMITPFSQFVGTQAVMNVITGERYKHVPNEIKKYVLGYYGRLLGPVDADVYDRIIENGSSDIKLKPEPIAPMLPELKRRYPKASEDELMLRVMFAGNQVDEMKKAIATRTSGRDSDGSLLSLLKALHKKEPGRKGSRISVQGTNFAVSIESE